MSSFFMKFRSQLSKAELVGLVRGLIGLGYFDESIVYTFGNEYKGQTLDEIEADLPEDEVGIVFVKGLDGGHLQPNHKLFDVLIEIDDTSVKWFESNQAIYSVSLRNDQIGFSLDGPSDIAMIEEAARLPNFERFVEEINRLTGDQLIGEVVEEFY